MCDLCGNEQERKEESERLKYEAVQLERLARYFRGMANGQILPHQGKEHDLIRSTGRGAVRFLVDHFVRGD